MPWRASAHHRCNKALPGLGRRICRPRRPDHKRVQQFRLYSSGVRIGDDAIRSRLGVRLHQTEECVARTFCNVLCGPMLPVCPELAGRCKNPRQQRLDHRAESQGSFLSTASREQASSSIEPKRSAGFLANIFMQILSKAGSIPSATSDGLAGVLHRMRWMTVDRPP